MPDENVIDMGDVRTFVVTLLAGQTECTSHISACVVLYNPGTHSSTEIQALHMCHTYYLVPHPHSHQGEDPYFQCQQVRNDARCTSNGGSGSLNGRTL